MATSKGIICNQHYFCEHFSHFMTFSLKDKFNTKVKKKKKNWKHLCIILIEGFIIFFVTCYIE